MKWFLSSLLLVATIPLLSVFSMTATAQTDTGSLSGKWILEPVLPSDTATGKTPTISFNLLTQTFAGFTGCNNMSGKFVARDHHLSFNPKIVLTKKMCEGYNEEEFVANLLRVTAYKIEGGVLTLMIDKTPISKWVRKTRSKLVVKR